MAGMVVHSLVMEDVNMREVEVEGSWDMRAWPGVVPCIAGHT